MFEALDREKSALIVIRHGESKYTNLWPDLTLTGIEQIRQTVINLRGVIGQFRQLLVYSSSATRAIGSADTFLQSLGLHDQVINIDQNLDPFALKNKEGFLERSKQYNTSRYGENWLRDPYYDSPDNDLTERRSDVNKRAYQFLNECFQKMSGDGLDEATLCVVFTHFEVMINYMKFLYRDLNGFPIETEPGPLNGEAIALQPNGYSPRNLDVISRSKLVRTEFDIETNRFKVIS